jgi:hypothetical protein
MKLPAPVYGWQYLNFNFPAADYKRVTPRRLKRKRNAAMIRNSVKSTLEIEAAPLATPEKSNKPATTATTSAIIAHCKRSILFLLPLTGHIVLLIFPFDG